MEKKNVSFANELWLSGGSRSDWPYFARWHYRGHHLAFTRKVILLWHGREPIGICVFGAPAASLTLRSKYFGLANPRSRVALAGLNQQLWLLQRVVLHPTYRGAGIAAQFVRRACRLCPVDWIETLSAMGQANPFFERAGFVRVGAIRKQGKDGKSGGTRTGHGAYGSGRRRYPIPGEALLRNRFSEPVYYVLDNRAKEDGSPSLAGEKGRPKP